MNRWDIINHFIEKNNYKTYLEIGYYKGWSFDQIKCDKKRAVDPNPLKSQFQIDAKYGSDTILANEKGIVTKFTSDDFFQDGRLSKTSWDIIFIDGLHEAFQVEKDIQNSLKHLSPGGTIILHDCNPPTYEHTTTGVDGCWTGDTYKAFCKFRLQYPEYESFTVDTDWGCGVISTPPGESDEVDMKEDDVSILLGWEHFDKHRKELLNLISVEEFLKKTNERSQDNNSAA